MASHGKIISSTEFIKAMNDNLFKPRTLEQIYAEDIALGHNSKDPYTSSSESKPSPSPKKPIRFHKKTSKTPSTAPFDIPPPQSPAIPENQEVTILQHKGFNSNNIYSPSKQKELLNRRRPFLLSNN